VEWRAVLVRVKIACSKTLDTNGVAFVDIIRQPRTRRDKTSTQNAVWTNPCSVQP